MCMVHLPTHIVTILIKYAVVYKLMLPLQFALRYAVYTIFFIHPLEPEAKLANHLVQCFIEVTYMKKGQIWTEPK